MRGKKCDELSEKAPHPGQLACGELSRVLWRDVQGIVAGCLGAGCLCGELSGPRAERAIDCTQLHTREHNEYEVADMIGKFDSRLTI